MTDEGTAWRVEWARPGKTDEPDAPLSVEVRAGGALQAGRAEANLDGISRAAAVARGFRTPAVLGSGRTSAPPNGPRQRSAQVDGLAARTGVEEEVLGLFELGRVARPGR